MLSPRHVFDEILQMDLHLQEPRHGCQARAQVITDFLHAKKCITGRIWALPLEGHKNFRAPTLDIHGKPLTFPPSENGTKKAPLTWPWHVAATATTQSGNVVVFDPAIFSGPVPEQTWKDSFAREPVKILTLGKDEAPLYGWAGSCYSPEPQQEHYLDNKDIARLDLLDIKNRCASPDFDNPAYRPLAAPPIGEQLALRAR